MDRTFLGDLKKLRSLLVAQQRPLQPDLQLRSNDAVRGLPYDCFFFAMLQELLATQLDL